jgi:hypothetical protein
VSEAYFENLDDMARFCAGLTREGIKYQVDESSAAGRYCVRIFKQE